MLSYRVASHLIKVPPTLQKCFVAASASHSHYIKSTLTKTYKLADFVLLSFPGMLTCFRAISTKFPLFSYVEKCWIYVLSFRGLKCFYVVLLFITGMAYQWWKLGLGHTKLPWNNNNWVRAVCACVWASECVCVYALFSLAIHSSAEMAEMAKKDLNGVKEGRV